MQTFDSLVKKWMKTRKVQLTLDVQGDIVVATAKGPDGEETVVEEDIAPALRAAMLVYDVECAQTKRRLPIVDVEGMPWSAPDTLERHMEHAADTIRAKKLIPLIIVPVEKLNKVS